KRAAFCLIVFDMFCFPTINLPSGILTPVMVTADSAISGALAIFGLVISSQTPLHRACTGGYRESSLAMAWTSGRGRQTGSLWASPAASAITHANGTRAMHQPSIFTALPERSTLK